MSVNLGNVVGLLLGTTAPEKKYIFWSKILNILYPEETQLNYFNFASGQWEPLNNYYLPPVDAVGTNTPPAVPVIGDSYIIGTSPTGLWSGKPNQHVTWFGHSWSFIPPKTASTTKLKSDVNSQYAYNGTAWVVITGGSGSGTVEQFEVINPELISSGGTEIWEFDNTLYDKYAQCVLYDESTDLRLIAISNEVTTTKIIFTFVTGLDIPAGAYRCSVQGVQKDAPEPGDGLPYALPFTL